MKQRIALLALALLACVQNAPGQGYIYFSNRWPAPGLAYFGSASSSFATPIFYVDGTTRLVGTDYKADLRVYGLNGWILLNLNVPFFPPSYDLETFAGYFDADFRDGILDLVDDVVEVQLPPYTLSPGTVLLAQVVVWDSSKPIGNQPNPPYWGHFVFGESQPFLLTLGDEDFPGTLINMQSFALQAPWNNSPHAVAGVLITTGNGWGQQTVVKTTDTQVEATGPNGADVVLDGSKSNDPDGDPLTYTWYPSGNPLLGMPTVPYPAMVVTMGFFPYTWTLKVTDTYGASSTDDITIEVVDTVRPDTVIYGVTDSFGTGIPHGGTTPSSSIDVEVGGFDAVGIASYLYAVDGQPALSAPGPIISVMVSTSCDHAIEVWAVDIAGNMDPSPAVFAWEFTRPASPLFCVPPPPNLVAWWPFDETSGTISADIIGQNNGTQFNGPTPVCGMVEGALAFDGSNDFVFVPNTPSLNFGTGDFTIDCWLRTSQKTAPILDKRATIQGRYVGYQFTLYSGGLLLQMADGGMGSGWRNFFYIPNPGNGKPDVADGQWHFVALTVTRGQVGTFYVDGVAVHTFNPSAISGSLDNTAPLFIGRASPGLSNWQPFYGTLDELELFNRALSAAEILSIFTAGPDGKCK